MDESLHAIDIRVTRLEEQHKAKEKALDVFTHSLADYKATANEWRGTVSDVTAKCITRLEAQALFDRMGDKIDALEKSKNESAGKSSGFNASWLIIVAVVTLVLMGAGVIAAIAMKGH